MSNEVSPDQLIAHEKFKEMMPKFKFGDEVICKQSGPMAAGKIVGILPGLIFKTYSSPMLGWEKIDEDWKNKFVYMVLFNEPQKPLRYDEYQLINEPIKEEYLQKWYENLQMVCSIPAIEEDIQLFEFY